MKQQVCKTSSFIVDLEKSSFSKFESELKICQYKLPSFFKDKFNEFAILHNWAKENVIHPYYLNIPSKKLYVLIPAKSGDPTFAYDSTDLTYLGILDYNKRENFHIVVKILLAQYFELTEAFVSNNAFFLHASVNRSKTWATVLKVEVVHNYKNSNRLEFFIKDSATRLKKISVEEYEKYYLKEVIYGQSMKNGQLFFKQLKKSETKNFSGLLFSKPKTGFLPNSKSKINYHSIEDSHGYESSKAYLLERFSDKFIKFLNQYDINVFSKQLNLVKVDFSNHRAGINAANFNVSIIDGRKNRKHDLNQLFQSSEAITYRFAKIEELKDGDNCLFVMDYNKDDFEVRFKGEADPYKSFKDSLPHLLIAKQGICLNENYFSGDSEALDVEEYLNYEGLSPKDLERNIEICITQLFLKNQILNGQKLLLPHKNILKMYSFCYRNHLFFIEGSELRIEKFETSIDLLNKISLKHPLLDMEDVFKKVFNYHNPFPTTKEFDFLTHRLIFNDNSVIEILDIPERAFYDEPEVKHRIGERNQLRYKTDFKSQASDPISIEFNELIDEEIESVKISYEELKSKYGKGEKGFFKYIFNAKNEKPFLKFIQENTTLKIKGLKQDNIFSTYTGIWYDRDESQYFVGRTHGYQSKQDKGVQIKKIITHLGEFADADFFELLNVDFIRYKELTVNPYPFKLIEMFEIITAPSETEQ